MGELTALLCLYGHRGDVPPLPDPLYLQQEGGKASYRVMGAEELVLPLTCCRTRGSGHCISPGGRSKADPVVGAELSKLRGWECGKIGSTILLAGGGWVSG